MTENAPSGWHLHPSLWFDALCLTPLLADLEFYTSRHVEDAALWQQRFREHADQRAMDAVAVLRSEVAEQAGKPLPAYLTLWCSPAAASTPTGSTTDAAVRELDALIAAVEEPGLLPRLMRETSSHWSETDEQLFERIQPALAKVLQCLRGADLAEWWVQNARDSLDQRIAELEDDLRPYDLVPLIEQHTGMSLGSRKIEVCILRWAAPHAIRVTGVRFLGDVRYRTSIVLNNSVHELLHPPWPEDHRLKKQLARLADDPFLAARFAARPRDAGYNDWMGYAEEDAAQALDQVLNKKLGLAGDPIERWTTADEGMHVLALLLHDVMDRGGFADRDETYADFLSRALEDTSMWPQDLGARFRELTG